jgi:lipoic acid synthetase
VGNEGPSRKTDTRRLPEWLRKPPGSESSARDVKKLLRGAALNTVCEEARCPNISECFSRGTATFMILGDICTRGCRFCSVITGKPTLPAASFEEEASRVADAAEQLGLSHVVVTSVARDELEDGGASGFVLTIRALRERLPGVTVEVLTPDFRGRKESIRAIALASPDILNHNLETVPRLYRRVRPGSSYQRSLDLLAYAKQVKPDLQTKTGIMFGLGENEEEVRELLGDARRHNIDIFTGGQYLQPTREHLPVEEFLTPARFKEFEVIARDVGFRKVFMGPLVRSSYHADEFVN